MELRRPHAALTSTGHLVGGDQSDAEMQKRVREMIKTFLQRASTKLENELEIEEQVVPVP